MVIEILCLALGTLPPGNTGDFYVSNYGNHRVEVYDASGAHLRSFTAASLDGPRGIVRVPGGNTYVASQGTNEVFVFDQGEQYITKFSAPGTLLAPTGMALSPGGDLLYVGGYTSDNVVVFDLDGNEQRAFTAPGINGTNCVAFDSSGAIYVASAFTGNLLKFSPAETYMTTFDTSEGNGLSSPMGIARDSNDVLYVAGGGSNNIVKFATDGTYLGQLTHPDLTGPQGVAFDERGHLFSASFFQNKLVEFDAAGEYVQTITDGGLSIPRSIAFRPLPAGDATGDGVVNVNDLVAVISAWGTDDADADLTHDGVVSVDDLVRVIEDWGN